MIFFKANFPHTDLCQRARGSTSAECDTDESGTVRSGPSQRDGDLYLFTVRQRASFKPGLRSLFAWRKCSGFINDAGADVHGESSCSSIRWCNPPWSGCSNLLHQLFRHHKIVKKGERSSQSGIQNPCPIQYALTDQKKNVSFWFLSALNGVILQYTRLIIIVSKQNKKKNFLNYLLVLDIKSLGLGKEDINVESIFIRSF